MYALIESAPAPDPCSEVKAVLTSDARVRRDGWGGGESMELPAGAAIEVTGSDASTTYFLHDGGRYVAENLEYQGEP